MKRILLMALCALSLGAHADSKSDKVARLLTVTHADENVQKSLDESRRGLEIRANLMYSQYLNKFSPTAEFRDEFNKITEQYLRQVQGVMTRETFMSKENKYLNDKLTEKELDDLITFYSSPLGQKFSLVMQEARHQAFTDYETQVKAIEEQAYAKQKVDMQGWSARCKCTKGAGPAAGSTK